MTPPSQTAATLTATGPSHRGLLVAVEGINGVGKTHLTRLLVSDQINAGRPAPLVLEEFSKRDDDGPDLGRALLRILKDASGRDRFLRSGHPATETLLLLAIKMHDYETSRTALAAGRLVLEGRSLHTIAVYQSLLTYPDDSHALDEARSLLRLGSRWRPLPDRIILVTDDVETAVSRAEQRDAYNCPPDERHLHHRAAALYEHLAADDPERIRILDRRQLDTDDAVEQMRLWVNDPTPA
jgi:dTMP kinase